MTPDFEEATILVRTTLSGSRAIEETLSRIREYVANRFPAELRVRLTGNLVLLSGTTSEIVAGQVKSLALALSVIFVVLSLMFLSVRIGLLAILPNVFPILLFFGVMGWLGIDLNLGTSLIAAIVLGIAIDSTIHYMARLNLRAARRDRSAGRHHPHHPARRRADHLRHRWRCAPGSWPSRSRASSPSRTSAVLSSVTMAASLSANLVLLPSLLAQLQDHHAVGPARRQARRRPRRTPFRSSPGCVRRRPGWWCSWAISAASRPAETIVHQGERGDEMFVLIKGKADVWLESERGRHRIAEMRRGDVFGEMGLVRGGTERSADVLAANEVEALAVDERFLQRIQRRYPRIASKVLLNLSRILSDRLERANERFMEAQAG